MAAGAACPACSRQAGAGANNATRLIPVTRGSSHTERIVTGAGAVAKEFLGQSRASIAGLKVVLLGVVAEGAVANLEEFGGASAHATCGFEGDLEIAALELGHLLLEVEPANGHGE